MIQIRHASEQTAKCEMGESTKRESLSEKIVLLILGDVQTLVNVCDCHVAPSDRGEHRLCDRLVVCLAGVEGHFRKEILSKGSLLEILLGDTHLSGVRDVRRVVPRERILLEKVVVERVRDMDPLHVLSSVGLVDPIEIFAERGI